MQSRADATQSPIRKETSSKDLPNRVSHGSTRLELSEGCPLGPTSSYRSSCLERIGSFLQRTVRQRSLPDSTRSVDLTACQISVDNYILFIWKQLTLRSSLPSRNPVRFFCVTFWDYLVNKSIGNPFQSVRTSWKPSNT